MMASHVTLPFFLLQALPLAASNIDMAEQVIEKCTDEGIDKPIQPPGTAQHCSSTTYNVELFAKHSQSAQAAVEQLDD